MTSVVSSPECLSSRIARAGRHVDRGEWASGHAILSGLRRCAQRGGCPVGESCATAAELLMGDVRRLLCDQNGTAVSHP
jgi:hypothetical protein